MCQTMRKTNPLQQVFSLLFGFFKLHIIAEHQGHGYIFQCRKFWQQMMKLIHKTQMPVAHIATLCGGQGIETATIDHHSHCSWSIQSTQNMQSGTYTRTTRPDNRDKL